MLFFSLMFSMETFLALPIWIQLACAFSVGLSGITPVSHFVVILKPVSLQDVFLPPMLSVGTVTSLTKTVFCLRILVRFLFVFILMYVCFLFSLFFVFFYFGLACNWPSCCCQSQVIN
jgi:hypothetical protein